MCIFQSVLLGLGAVKYSLLFSGNIIILQSAVKSLMITITMEESANISLIEEQLQTLANILQPYASLEGNIDS